MTSDHITLVGLRYSETDSLPVGSRAGTWPEESSIKVMLHSWELCVDSYFGKHPLSVSSHCTIRDVSRTNDCWDKCLLPWGKYNKVVNGLTAAAGK